MKGLMFRQAMGEAEGMLFVFTAPQQQSFWMRNTTLPLDIGFFDPAGELKEIYPMYPLDERLVKSRNRNIQFCLEMNQGWFKRNDVKPGAKLDLKAVAEALKARGLKPEQAETLARAPVPPATSATCGTPTSARTSSARSTRSSCSPSPTAKTATLSPMS